jgi:transposase
MVRPCSCPASNNVIERCFCRLKDFRRVATRYDKLARNFLAAVHLAAIVAYRIN